MSPPRHKTSADPFPPLLPGRVRLYNMQYCPFALRAVLILTKKGVDYERININLRDKPAWFLEKYPVGTVPVLEIDDKVIGESLVITEYIDDAFPGEKIIPTDPYVKARTNMLLQHEISKAIGAIYDRLYKREGWMESINEHVGKLEKMLDSQKFFAGKELGYADYMIYPWLRCMVPPIMDDVLPTGRFKNLEKWLSNMKEDETIKKCDTPPDILVKFTVGYATKNFQFDFEVCD